MRDRIYFSSNVILLENEEVGLVDRREQGHHGSVSIRRHEDLLIGVKGSCYWEALLTVSSEDEEVVCPSLRSPIL